MLTISPAHGHDPDVPELEIPEVSVIGERPVAASSQQFIPDKEYLLQPQGRPAQVLRLIPGFLAVEHSGGAGKADQYFLRGFDADHGTDVASCRRHADQSQVACARSRLIDPTHHSETTKG
jgi:hypothetical protein